MMNPFFIHIADGKQHLVSTFASVVIIYCIDLPFSNLVNVTISYKNI